MKYTYILITALLAPVFAAPSGNPPSSQPQSHTPQTSKRAQRGKYDQRLVGPPTGSVVSGSSSPSVRKKIRGFFRTGPVVVESIPPTEDFRIDGSNSASHEPAGMTRAASSSPVPRTTAQDRCIGSHEFGSYQQPDSQAPKSRAKFHREIISRFRTRPVVVDSIPPSKGFQIDRPTSAYDQPVLDYDSTPASSSSSVTQPAGQGRGIGSQQFGSSILAASGFSQASGSQQVPESERKLEKTHVLGDEDESYPKSRDKRHGVIILKPQITPSSNSQQPSEPRQHQGEGRPTSDGPLDTLIEMTLQDVWHG